MSKQLLSNVAASVGDCSDKRKDNVLERLSKRNKERQNHLDVRLEQRNKENVQLENPDYIAQAFSERVHNIETHMKSINNVAATSKNNDDNINVELTRLFADLTFEIKELQRYLNSSTMFLTDYKINKCQIILNELTNNSEEMRLRLLPRKKFAFSGKKVASKLMVNSKVSAKNDKVDAPKKSLAALSSKDTTFTSTLANRMNEYIFLEANEVNGKDITIINLQNCFVEFRGHAGSVQISKALDCTFLFGPISRSVFAEHCQRINLAVACQQLRLHSSAACRIYMHVTCRAIIEDCTKVEIANYNYNYSAIDTDFQLAGLDKTKNNYADVADFNWLSVDVPSPNWKLLNDKDVPEWNELRQSYQNQLVSL